MVHRELPSVTPFDGGLARGGDITHRTEVP